MPLLNFTGLDFEQIKTTLKDYLKSNSDFAFEMIINNQDYTIINLIQAYISRYHISGDSFIQFCGCKKAHPLENIMIMILVQMDRKLQLLQMIMMQSFGIQIFLKKTYIFNAIIINIFNRMINH